jgi:membrane fusion protein (multidrug efflux system)
VAAPEERTFVDPIIAVGTAQATESVTLSAKVTDVVKRINFEAGKQVAKGQVLIELAAVEQLADLAEAKANLADAERAYKRYSDLAEKGFAPRARLDEALAARDTAQARVEASAARASDHIIRAPFTGVVGLRQASPGLLVTPGTALATLDDVSVIKLDFDVPETAVAHITKGAQFEARSEAYPDAVFKGEVAEIDTRIAPETRSMRVRAFLQNKDGRLKPGMLLSVRVDVSTRRALAVNELALVEEGGASKVFVVRDDGKGPMAFPVVVTIGARTGGMAEVLTGLNPTDQVVVDGAGRVRPKGKVRLLDAEEANASAPQSGGGRPSASF